MGEVTTLALNAPNKASLRTTIPMFIVKQWGLKSGDKLDWSLEARKNEMVIVVKKAEDNNKNKKKR
jgi:bifunctional DNA-binding transcriptional regulator/antitoxin component of YhaV-PrlF toxin-antitoxin module